jgi:AcrR family transcriptional regulator
LSSQSDPSKRFEPGIVPQRRPGKEGGARDRNRRERTRSLCEAAVGLFLDKGVEATTVDDITRVAGVAKGSFYRYFEGKPQLVEALFAPVEEAVVASMKRCRQALSRARTAAELKAAYAALAGELSAVMLTSPDLVRLYLQESRGPAHGGREPIRRLSDTLMEGAVTLTKAARRQGLLRELPPRVTAVAVVGAVEAMLVEHFERGSLGEPMEATAALIAMVLDGVRKVGR